MTFRFYLVLFFIFMSAGIGSYQAVKSGFYPVAAVNFDIVTARTIEQNYAAAFRYFQKALLVSGSDPERLNSLQSQQELKRGVLDKLVTDSLVYQELKRRISKREFQPIAERKISQFIADNKNVGTAAQELYGLDLSDFKRRVLLPQAYQEILEGRMNLNGENFNDWLQKEKANASIIILTPDLEWKAGGVKLSN